jgi:flagellar assembly protein FliH
LSNIIKSFKVIEGSSINEEDIELKSSVINKELLKEAQKKCKYIITKAKKEAEKIIDSAYKEYENNLNKAYEKAKSILEEHQQIGYEKGYQIGKEEGFRKGYEDGYKQGKEEAQKIINEALKIKEEYINKNNQLLKEAEKDIVNLVIEIYEKVLYKKVNEEKELIVSLVENGIKDLEIKGKLTIIVSKYDYEAIVENKNRILAKATLVDDIDIRVDNDMAKGDCILETSKGDINISISDQMKEIKELIISILNNE